MPNRFTAGAGGLVLAWAAGWAAEPAEDPLRTLLDHSPFVSHAPGGETAAGTTPLEWRGIMREANEPFFSVFEASTQRGRWVRLNETGQPFLVRSYDPAQGALVVGYQRHDLVLKLKRAKVTGLPPAAPLAIGVGPGASVAGAASAPAAVVVDDEAIRLAIIAQEIARRQALRRQAARATATAAPAAEPAFTPSP